MCREGGAGGSPESEDLPVASNSNPSRKEDSCTGSSSVGSPSPRRRCCSSFGPYIDQIGRYVAGGSTGWVFKVNGVSPPVGADAVALKDGDRVLWYWATFSSTGGPPTLVLQSTKKRNCYRVLAQNDQGKTKPARGARLHAGSRSVVARTGAACLSAHTGLVTATLKGAVRSNALR